MSQSWLKFRPWVMQPPIQQGLCAGFTLTPSALDALAPAFLIAAKDYDRPVAEFDEATMESLTQASMPPAIVDALHVAGSQDVEARVRVGLRYDPATGALTTHAAPSDDLSTPEALFDTEPLVQWSGDQLADVLAADQSYTLGLTVAGGAQALTAVMEELTYAHPPAP